MESNNNKIKKLSRLSFSTAKQDETPLVSLTPRDGKLTFNFKARTMMDLKGGGFLNVFEEKLEKTTRFGFQKTDDANEFCLRQRQNTSRNPSLCITNKALQRHIQDTIDMHGIVRGQIASEPDGNGIWWILESSWKRSGLLLPGGRRP